MTLIEIGTETVLGTGKDTNAGIGAWLRTDAEIGRDRFRDTDKNTSLTATGTLPRTRKGIRAGTEKGRKIKVHVQVQIQ